MSDEEPPKRRWTGKPTSGSGERQMTTNVKNKKVKESSRNWIRRQLNDPYVARARADGYRARAAYKLLELDEQFHILKRGARVIDRGRSSRSFARVVASMVESSTSRAIGSRRARIRPSSQAARTR